ncbi:MAG: DUF1028 domain-containing protein [Planctomycetota bacterium]
MTVRMSLVLTLVAVTTLASPSGATWSIVVVDSATGEVGIAGATCIAGENLKATIGTLRVGWGAGAAQAAVSDKGRRIIGAELGRRTPPDQILYLATHWDDRLEIRQYGIADMTGQSVSFTGDLCAAWAGQRNGRAGTVAYAIQGNILVSEAVALLAEQALLETTGPLCDRLMAAMNAAARAGGDARCTQHRKSAHVAFMIVSRIGDDDGICPFGECINGTYFLELNVSDTVGSDPDPVWVLTNLYREWRAQRSGRADHLTSRVTFAPPTILADGTSTTLMTIHLFDLLGERISWGGARLDVAHDATSAGATQIGPVFDDGDGSYTVELTAGTRPGRDVFRVSVVDGFPPGNLTERPVLLYPFPILEVATPLRLFGTATKLDLSRLQNVDFLLRAPSSFGNRLYLMLATASGTSPGFPLGSITVPLNIDPLLVQSYLLRNVPPFVNTSGALDPGGEAAASFQPAPGELDPFIGRTLHFAWFVLDPANAVSNTFGVTIED